MMILSGARGGGRHLPAVLLHPPASMADASSNGPAAAPAVEHHPQTSGLTTEALAAFDNAVSRTGHRRRSLSSVSQQSVAKAIGTLGVEAADAVVTSVMVSEMNRVIAKTDLQQTSVVEALEREGVIVSPVVEKRRSSGDVEEPQSEKYKAGVPGAEPMQAEAMCCAVQ